MYTSIPKGDYKRFVSFVHANLVPRGTVFAAWQHRDIPELVKNLGMPNYDKFANWPHECNAAAWNEPDYIRDQDGSHCYDIIWQMRFEEAAPGKWLPLGVTEFHEGFGGLDSSPCAQQLRKLLMQRRKHCKPKSRPQELAPGKAKTPAQAAKLLGSAGAGIS